MTRRSRWEARKDDPVDVHLRLLDDDTDTFDDRIAAMEARQAKMFWMIVGASFTTGTSFLLLAANLVVITR